MQNKLADVATNPSFIKAAEIIMEAEKNGRKLGFYNDID